MININKAGIFISAIFSMYLISNSFNSFAAAQIQQEQNNIEHFQITGSRIKRIEFEGPNPITVITADDIKTRGFNTIY